MKLSEQEKPRKGILIELNDSADTEKAMQVVKEALKKRGLERSRLEKANIREVHEDDDGIGWVLDRVV